MLCILMNLCKKFDNSVCLQLISTCTVVCVYHSSHETIANLAPQSKSRGAAPAMHYIIRLQDSTSNLKAVEPPLLYITSSDCKIALQSKSCGAAPAMHYIIGLQDLTCDITQFLSRFSSICDLFIDLPLQTGDILNLAGFDPEQETTATKEMCANLKLVVNAVMELKRSVTAIQKGLEDVVPGNWMKYVMVVSMRQKYPMASNISINYWKIRYC